MSDGESPSRAEGKRPVNSVLNVRHQHPALARVLSKSDVQLSDYTCNQLFRQAETLLNDIGYKNGKVMPKLLTKTPERYRRNIRAPGPSVVPQLNLEGFDPDRDSALQVPRRTAAFQEKPLSSFREVPKPAKRQPISLRPSRPDTNRSGRPSESQVRSRTLRDAMHTQDVSPNERALLRKKSKEQQQLVSSQVRASLTRKLSRSYKMGIFSKQDNKTREDSLFTLEVTARIKSEVSPVIRSLKDKMVEKRTMRMTSRLETDESSPSTSHKSFVHTLEKNLIDTRWLTQKKDYFFDHDPEEILDRFKWFSNERVQQLIPSQNITHMPTMPLKTAR